MINPKGTKVLVEPNEIPETTEGGIVIPDSVRDRERYGSVRGVLIAVGKDAWLGTEPFAKIGDKVFIAKYSGIIAKDGDKAYLILNDEDVLATITEDGESNGK